MMGTREALHSVLSRRGLIREQTDKTASVQAGADRGVALAHAAMQNPDLAHTARHMSKQSAMGDFMRSGLQYGVGMAAAAGLYGAGNMALSAVRGAYKSLTEGKHKAKAYSQMMAASDQLGKEDTSKVQRAFNTLYKFNPEAATDPLMASSFVQRAVDYGAVTTDEMSKLVNMRKGLSDAEAREDVFGGGFVNPGAVKTPSLASHLGGQLNTPS